MDDAAQFSSVFDAPEAEPSELFINPFACNVSPLLWRELQVTLKCMSSAYRPSRCNAQLKPNIDDLHFRSCNAFEARIARLLQEVARSADDPVSVLAAQGVYLRDSAVFYLTPCQLAAITADLEAMEDSMALELTSWFVSDCLMRAARANERIPAQRRS